MDYEHMKSGRTPFNPPSGKVDFSGEDFVKIYFGPHSSLDHAYLNGIEARDCGFYEINMVQVELAQSEVSSSQFSSVDMTGTDIVETSFNDIVFTQCRFTEGEWRESNFTNCSFIDCNFNHTTINLCTFRRCSFDSPSLLNFSQRGKNYNTFVGSTFASGINDEAVLSRNFSLPSTGVMRAVALSGDDASLEAICLASSSGIFHLGPIVEAIENELLSSAKLKSMRIRFISNVIDQLSANRRISPATLLYIADMFHKFARSTPSDSDLRTAMLATIKLRSAIYDSSHMDNMQLPDGSCACSHLQMCYRDNLQNEDALALVDLLNSTCSGAGGTFIIEKIIHGSLIIELAVSGVLSLNVVLEALNIMLRQATILVRSATTLRKAWHGLREPIHPSLPVARNSENYARQGRKLSAIERNSSLEDSMKPVHAAVRKVGRRVANVDRPAEVTIDMA